MDFEKIINDCLQSGNNRVWVVTDWEAAKTLVRSAIYAAQREAAEQKMHPTLGESTASDSESKPAPKRVI